MSDSRPIILDTDIGTDVDDIFALVLLARSPALDLVGVTTVYGDTGLRTTDLPLCARHARATVDRRRARRTDHRRPTAMSGGPVMKDLAFPA